MGLIPSIIAWALWTWRCKARMEGKVVSIEALWISIKVAISWVGMRLKAGRKIQVEDVQVLEELAIPFIVPKHKKVHIVKWLKPAEGSVKLNVDGSYRGNLGRMGAGGIIHDNKANMLLAFLVGLGHGTHNAAEFMAVLYGLQYCKEMGLMKVEVELDSMLVVNLLEKKRCGIWYLEDFWDEILEILSSRQAIISHIFRECNADADFLARLDTQSSRTWTNYGQL